jgi:hypothetical protein
MGFPSLTPGSWREWWVEEYAVWKDAVCLQYYEASEDVASEIGIFAS